MTSSGGEPKIYLRGVTPHILIHGGLGHRPPLCEELDLIWFIWILFGPLVYLVESTKFGFSCLILANLVCLSFPQLLSLS